MRGSIAGSCRRLDRRGGAGMPVLAIERFERCFRAAAGLDVDKSDLKRYGGAQPRGRLSGVRAGSAGARQSCSATSPQRSGFGTTSRTPRTPATRSPPATDRSSRPVRRDPPCRRPVRGYRVPGRDAPAAVAASSRNSGEKVLFCRHARVLARTVLRTPCDATRTEYSNVTDRLPDHDRALLSPRAGPSAIVALDEVLPTSGC